MYRHRWIIDQWVWELPGSYVDHTEDMSAAAAREVEEETGWRPRTMQHLVTYQPAIGTLDHPQDIYLAHGADLTDTQPDINEAEMIRWVPLDEAMRMIDRGEIVVGVYRALLEDRGVGGRPHARSGGPSFTEWLDATYPVKG